MKLYPLFLNFKNRSVLLIGAGPVAAQKVKTLLACGAHVHVVAPKALPAIRALASAKRVRWSARRYRTSDLKGAILVIAATNDSLVQKRIVNDSRRRKIFVNCVSAPLTGDFYNAAIVNHGTVQIAISTGGTAPALAKRLRQQLETFLEDHC